MFNKLVMAFILILAVACSKKPASLPIIDLSSGWKFMNQDDLQFAQPDFDDSNWKTIQVNQVWEKQGFANYDGFAWYRIRVFIPSTLKEKAVLKDSLVFNLGKIDDFDQVFLNGQLIGENLKTMPPSSMVNDAFKDLRHSYWNVQRRYVLPVNDPRIKWDQENVLAVRVFDWGGAGGIYSGTVNIMMPDYADYLALQNTAGVFESSEQTLSKSLKLVNKSSTYNIEGQMKIEARNNINGQILFSKSFDFAIKPKQKFTVAFNLSKPKQSTTIDYELQFKGGVKTLKSKEDVPYILTPPVKPQPQINGALVYGQRPGKPFLYRIAATGQKPLEYCAEGLPEGLELDAETGIIKGVVNKQGTYAVKVTVSNALGSDSKVLRFVIGDRIALTPPMGWNSWNVWGLSVTQEHVYAAAKAFIEKGLADHGWTYINIDDGWEIYGKAKEPKRKPNGEIRTNEKFPNMKKLGDDIHALGLKFGIYSSPGPLTCGGYTGGYQHEEQDARTFARWGVDYLKYDLCTYRQFMKDPYDPQELMPPYIKMHKALQKVNRDIVYSICEYGNGKVWEWGAKVGGNLWRTTGDIWDDWDRMFSIGFNQEEAAPYNGPGHWNDPDMLVIGWVGWGPHLHYTRLTPDEQYTHISLWCLLSAPLLLGCDLERLDEFTLNLITNDEVLAINQDPFGNQAVPKIKTPNIHVYVKKLADGNLALGIFNISTTTQTFTLDLQRIGLEKTVKIRDLWRQQDLGQFSREFKTTVPPHGVTLVKVFKE